MASLSSFILSPSPFSVIDFVGIVDGGDEGQLWWCAGEMMMLDGGVGSAVVCLLYTSPSPRDGLLSRMPSSA